MSGSGTGAAAAAVLVLATVLAVAVARDRSLPHWGATLMLVFALVSQYLAVWRWWGDPS
jgi:hypothetical protein